MSYILSQTTNMIEQTTNMIEHKWSLNSKLMVYYKMGDTYLYEPLVILYQTLLHE